MQLKLVNYVKKRMLASKINASDNIYLNVGAGGTVFDGWFSIEKEILDITNKNDFAYFFANKKISKILAEHVIEHIEKQQFIDFLLSVKKYLEFGASIRIAVPDAFHPSEYLRELTKPGGLEPGADDHKVFYSIDLMKEIAQKTNYRIKPVEYFDATGIFHSNLDGWNNGYISRSSSEYDGLFITSEVEYKKLFDTVPEQLRDQFKKYNISYTSLIVDLINA